MSCRYCLCTIEILNSEKLLIPPPTIKCTADKLQFKNATPENTQAFTALVKKGLDHYFNNSQKEDIKFIDTALHKLGNPSIQDGEENLLDVANRIAFGCEIAQIAIEKKFPMLPAKRGTRLNLFIEDIRKIALKLRLLGDIIETNDLTPKIDTDISLTTQELKASKLQSDKETGDKLIRLSDKFLLIAVRLTNQGVEQALALPNNTLLSSIKECEPEISSEESNEILKLAKSLIEGNYTNPKSIEMIATYLANQNQGHLSAIKLTVASYRKKMKFNPRSLGFIRMKVKDIRLEDLGLQREWAWIASKN